MKRSPRHEVLRSLAFSAVTIGGGSLMAYTTLWKMINLQPLNCSSRSSSSSYFAFRPGEALWWAVGLITVLIGLAGIGFGIGRLWLQFGRQSNRPDR